ncbi:MAP3K7 C-terminal-like protein isoform X3 [Mauremys reevesii]|uniref:MAP3K7 C-terminal-like protein isoform X3 n=1 Tax=Mauremys reevesii TaxID=260615 RepID=UPI00193FC9DF|nr:MAP3K7 C-terminal-like protein isoform X3 [Mauremys reevesii]
MIRREHRSVWAGSGTRGRRWSPWDSGGDELRVPTAAALRLPQRPGCAASPRSAGARRGCVPLPAQPACAAGGSGALLEHTDKRVDSSAHMITTARVPADKPVRIAFSLNDSPDVVLFANHGGRCDGPVRLNYPITVVQGGIYNITRYKRGKGVFLLDGDYLTG